MALISSDQWKPQGIPDLENRAWEALHETSTSTLVTAGAGAGKTEFLAQKATYLLQTGICPDPKRILAISFKRDAARNLTERVQKRCPPQQARRFHSMTFDAFTKDMLDRFRSAIPEPFSPPADYRIVFPRNQDFESFLQTQGFPSIDRRRFERAIARTPLPIDPIDDLTSAVAIYWHEQYANGTGVLLSFPMINRLVEWLLRENPEIRRALHLTYPFVFLDEFQDTTYAQYDVLRIAFSGSPARFTAVGDDKQRVMVWAGAMRDGFDRFKTDYGAKHIPLLSNWRSHEDLVRIQHVIASQLDPNVEYPKAHGKRESKGDIAAIWEFTTNLEQDETLATWIAREIRSHQIPPHRIALLVRVHANKVEEQLLPAFSQNGVRLRNVARNVGDIAIQDLLGEDLTEMLLPLLRIAAETQSPNNWNQALSNLQFLDGISSDDDVQMERLHRRLEDFSRKLRHTMNKTSPDSAAARQVSGLALDFLSRSAIQRTFGAYQKHADFDRVWEGFQVLIRECAQSTASWPEVLDRFEGLGQVVLMTIHKSKGLEFHTMIVYGLDDGSWWNLKPKETEELNSFYVAFTRAEQRAFFSLSKERGNPVTWIEQILGAVNVMRIKGKTILAEVPTAD